jgi:hypothetical protein
MQFLIDLWQPILASAVLVWFASFVCHMVLPLHKGEFNAMPREEATLETLQGIGAGNYMFPFGTPADMKNPEFVEKQRRGPNGTLTVWTGPVNMGMNLVLTLLSYILISALCAYIVWNAFVGRVFVHADIVTLVGVAAFLGHGTGLIPHYIWYKGPRLGVALLEALIYAVITGMTFAWLWNHSAA